MKQEWYKLLKDLVAAQAPSGFETAVQKVYRTYVAPCAHKVYTDRIGNEIAVLDGTSDTTIMIAGHADEIGLIVNYISDDYVIVKSLGGVDVSLLPGLRVTIHTNNGPVHGVIGKKPIHQIRNENNTTASAIDELWIDIGSTEKEKTKDRVQIGNFVTFNGEFIQLSEDIICSKSFDNRVGVFTAATVLENLSAMNCPHSIYSVSTVQEEVGSRGAKTATYQIKPDIAIAVDVTFTSDYPGINKNVYGDVKLGSGPVISLGTRIDQRYVQQLIKIAEDKSIPYQIEINPSNTGTDADSIHTEIGGVSTLVISIPCRYMHTPNEVVSLTDIENTVQLITQFILSI